MVNLHDAYGPELRRALWHVPFAPGHRLVDVACGDGAFTGWLAERVTDSGQVVGVDIDPGFTELARERNAAGNVAFRLGDARALPLETDRFDGAWCAQSLRSLPDVDVVLHEIRRVLRPGGCLAVMETDALHQLILPWPAELELKVRQAERESIVANFEEPEWHYVGRDLRRPLLKASFEDVQVRCYSVLKTAPFEAAVRRAGQDFLDALRTRVQSWLSPSARDDFEVLTARGSTRHMLDQPDAFMTFLFFVAHGWVGPHCTARHPPS